MGWDYVDEEDRDVPLAVKYETSSLWKPVRDLLGVKPTGAAIAIAAVEARKVGGRWISYSRSRNFYDNRQCHPLLTYRKTVGAVDALEAGGWIDHFRQERGVRGRQSAFRATPDLLEAMQGILDVKPSLPLELPRYGVVMRDSDGRPLALPTTREVGRMNKKVAAINEGLVSIDARHECGPQLAAPITRIFNLDFERGGRLYAQGSSWQNLKKATRQAVRIGDEPVIELDYATLHPAMLYAEAGAPLPADCYALKGWGRQLVKRAFLILVNAATAHTARLAIAHCPEMQALRLDEQEAKDRASRLIAAIKEAHRPIAKAFHSDAGARLMRKDSEMAQQVLLALHAKGIVALPMHDSFLVPLSKRYELEGAMQEAAYKVGLAQLTIAPVAL